MLEHMLLALMLFLTLKKTGYAKNHASIMGPTPALIEPAPSYIEVMLHSHHKTSLAHIFILRILQEAPAPSPASRWYVS